MISRGRKEEERREDGSRITSRTLVSGGYHAKWSSILLIHYSLTGNVCSFFPITMTPVVQGQIQQTSSSSLLFVVDFCGKNLSWCYFVESCIFRMRWGGRRLSHRKQGRNLFPASAIGFSVGDNMMRNNFRLQAIIEPDGYSLTEYLSQCMVTESRHHLRDRRNSSHWRPQWTGKGFGDVSCLVSVVAPSANKNKRRNTRISVSRAFSFTCV